PIADGRAGASAGQGRAAQQQRVHTAVVWSGRRIGKRDAGQCAGADPGAGGNRAIRLSWTLLGRLISPSWIVPAIRGRVAAGLRSQLRRRRLLAMALREGKNLDAG